MSESKTHSPRRGEIYLVQFDPTRGAEIQKTRPALIIQNDVSNRHASITIAAAITSRQPRHPTDVPITAAESGLDHDSIVVLNQIRSVDKVRLVRRLGRVPLSTMLRVDQAIAISLGLVESP